MQAETENIYMMQSISETVLCIEILISIVLTAQVYNKLTIPRYYSKNSRTVQIIM